MTNTTNTDDLLIVSDEVKTDNDFLFFDDISEIKTDSIISFDEVSSEIEAETKEITDIDFGFSFDTPVEAKEELEEIVSEEISETTNDFNFLSPNIEVETTKEEVYSSEVRENMTNTVGDLNSILDETISKLELRKTNLFALKDNKTSSMEELNKQIESLKSQVKELQGEVKGLEVEDEQIAANITALQSMKMGESVNNKDYKKIAKKIA